MAGYASTIRLVLIKTDIQRGLLLSVTSNIYGANILIDGVDTGFVTPHTFVGPLPGTYTIEKAGLSFSPESHIVGQLSRDAEISFVAE